ncbi:hypothetical protein EDB84DRAFT_1647330 [Lactarius hengduanensis]|nr:hypothetical protein EDB84DRAFT_1647330 [Lactarius hengduanensis]
MPTQTDNALTAPTDVPPTPTPDEDGVYTCDICHMRIRVGYGGRKNFLQHRGSPGCLKAAKKDSKPTGKTSQTNTINSYFVKATQSGTSSKAQNRVARVAPQAAPPPRSSLPAPGPQRRASARPEQGADGHALALLANITRVAQELPLQIPEAEEHDDIARVILAEGPEDPSEAWEHLDRGLNRLLGYGVDIEDIAHRVRRGPLGVEGLTRYIHGFVVDYGIAGGLLEGKLERLLKAIERVNQMDKLLTVTERRGRRTIASVSPDCSPEVLPVGDDLLLRELTLSDAFPPPSSPRMRSVNTDDNDDDIEYIGTLPSSDAIAPARQDPSPPIAPGPPVKTAPPGQTGIGAYPFLLHVEEHTAWEFSSRSGTLLLHARRCENRNLNERGLFRIENGVNENTPYKFHGLTNMTEIARKKDRIIDLFRLRRTNDAKKLVGREGTISLHRQVLLAMSSGKIPRLDRVLRVASDRHMSVAAILDLVRKAGCGLYHPKGFDETEDLQTLLFLRLGGQRVADIAHRIFGIPAPSTVRRRTMIPPLVCSPSYPRARELEDNLVAALDSLLPTLEAQGKYHVVLMFDEIAQETRPRWCDRTNQILGWCREHTNGRCMDFNSIADAELLFQDMVDGNVHLAHEATVGAIGLLCKNSRFYCAKPFLISGSCKRETAEDHAKLIQTALSAIKAVNTLSNARVVSIASDGEAKRGKALVLLTFKRKLSPSSPIYPWLSACALLDLHVGDDDITCDKDWKHVAAKRPRNALLREKGILVHETWITPALLRSHLLEAGHKPQHVHAVLNPNDKQDVLLAYTLLRDIWSLPQLTSGAPGRIKARDSLRLLGSMCYHFLMPYICVDLSIGEQLEYLSYAAHLALVLYVHEKARNDFIPTALYVDLIMMVKNVFFCVAKAKIDTPNDDFSIVLLGTDRLENLFGCLRTIIGNDANVDNYQLGSRLTGTMESANILAMHPEWDKAPRRLHLPCVSRGSSEIPASADHISPRSWRASQALSSLTPPTVWIRGRRKLEADHPFVCDVLRAVEAIPDATLLAPFGTLLVHASLSGDDFEDSSHDNGLHSLVQDAVLSDHPDVPLAGGGMCELEDAAASLDWAPDQHSFSNVVAVDENTGTLNKSRALSLLFKYSKSTSSTDRLRRVQQEARFVQSEPETLVDDTSDELENVLMVNNPIASLVSCEENIFLCIGEIVGIHLGSKAVDYLRLDVLLEDTVHITYQVYSLVCTSPDDDKHDDNEHKYEWKTQNLLPIKFKVPGNLIQPINPSLAMSPSRAPFYLFETPTLIAFTSSLRDRLTKPQLKFIPQIAQSDRFPYRERSGEACFVAEALYDVRESSVHECPACAPPVQLDAANGQRAPGGATSGWSSIGVLYQCPNAIKFSYSAAMVSSESSPCSNVPLQCPYCPDGSPAVWRYNMQLHFRHRHQGVDTAKHEDLWKLTSAEAKAMAGIWKTRHKQPKRRGKGKQKVPLKLSEAHSSRKLSSYMAREDEMVLDEDQDSNVIEEGPGGNEYGDEEDDGISKVTEAEGWEPAGGEREDDAECIGESASSNEKDTQARSDCAESGDGVRGLGVVDERGGTKIGDVSVDLVAESNERAPEPPAGVPASPLADVAASLATGRRAGTEGDGNLLRGAQMSSFGRKRKLRNMQDISHHLQGEWKMTWIKSFAAERLDVKQNGTILHVLGFHPHPGAGLARQGHAYVNTYPPYPYRPYEKNVRPISQCNPAPPLQELARESKKVNR